MKALFVSGIGLALFIEFLLISKKDKSRSDKILALWMFLILVHLFFFTIHFSGDILEVPFLLGLEHPLPLLHGVFLFLYVSSLTGQFPARRWVRLLHFLPAIATYVYLLEFLLLPADQKIFVYQNRGVGYEAFSMVKWYAVAISGIAYVVASTVLLRRHTRRIRDRFSNLDKVNLRWLQFLTIGLGCIWFLVIFFSGDTLIFTGVVVFVFLIGFFGIRQTVIIGPAGIEDEETKPKYHKSGLTGEAAQNLHQKLVRMMTDEALFKKSDLSITELSSRLGVHPNYLSQAINQTEGKNFYDFVNAYRVEEFKRLIELGKNRQFTLLTLAYDCGFSSKTSFNRCFKRATGLTPSEYLSQRVTGTP